MSQSSRNPKDLRQMVYDNVLDNDVIHNDFDKLKPLSEDDKNENAKLRSRIDEQCQLIMILKQRADEGTVKIRTLEKINKELLEFRDEADAVLKGEIKKFNLLEGRFDSLASNHEEMIRIKDEYKRVNNELREQNAMLKTENEKLFSKTITEKDELILELDRKCLSYLEQSSSLEKQLRQSKLEWKSTEDTLRSQISELRSNHSQQVENILKQLQDAEDKLKGTEDKLQVQLASRHCIEEEASGKLQQLRKEKEELVALSLQRGKLVQKEQDENKALKKKIDEMERAVKNMENKFIRETEAVNANLRVIRLTDELQQADSKHSQLIKEFEAFKKHSSDLLRKEKELNDRLRQLYA